MQHLEILYEDESLLVINKPAGLIVNKSDTTLGGETLQDRVETKLKMKNEKSKTDEEESVFHKRSGIVHRLDKETSGVILVAKTSVAFEDLQRQFKERLVEKSYVALVHGRLDLQEGEIQVPVGRLPWNRMRFGVLAGGKEATTKYKVLSIKYKGEGNDKKIYTLIELYPKTGRTHQIRVHLKHIGHPIVSDPLYGGRKTARNDRKLLPRVFLHASSLTFFHPQSHEKKTITSPLPPELASFLAQL